MKRIFKTLFLTGTVGLTLAACGNASGNQTQGQASSGDSAADGELTMVWLPNESAQDSETSRQAIGEHIEDQTGLTVKHQLTTDYTVAVESIVNGQADLAFLGGQSYIEANAQNENVVPLVTPSGPSGTLDDALYNSWFAVNEEDAEHYQNENGEYSLDNVQGKRMSFVSQSSTSGFAVPTNNLMSHFDELNSEEQFYEGGEDQFFSEILFGQSHQGSLVNLLSGRADVSAVCDNCVSSYLNSEPVEGEPNEAGATYEVAEDAEAPFSNFAGDRFTVVSSSPVLNEPIAVNQDNLSEETIQSLEDVFTSEELNTDSRIWAEPDSDSNAILEKEGDSQFVPSTDEWYGQMR